MSALYNIVMYSLVFGVMAVMFGVSGRARQSIKPRHNQHVTSLKPADRLGQLGSIRPGAQGLLLEDVAAAGCLQLGDLTRKALIPSRDRAYPKTAISRSHL